MSDEAAAQKAEIVIIRRKSADDATAGKGGAWKIAYADFVTAMMAFFLVMWLINASNEATRSQVASYFNPIKLTDSSTGKRGVRDRKEGKPGQTGEAQEDGIAGTPTAEEMQKEEHLMANPEQTLNDIVGEQPKAKSSPTRDDSGRAHDLDSTRYIGTNPGVGDPFDPRSWESVPDREVEGSSSEDVARTEPTPLPIEKREGIPENPQPGPDADKSTPVGKVIQNAISEPVAVVVAPTPAPQTSSETKQPKPDVRAVEAQEIAKEISSELGSGFDGLPASVNVKPTDAGVLISVTDRQVFGMFKTGSAEPDARLVRLIGGVAKVLAHRRGYIVVRGHTDSRPFKNKKYDNWQLSTARAHLAQYMLVRGGLDERRIHRVEGVADREPQVIDDPQAAENRRIEILLGWQE